MPDRPPAPPSPASKIKSWPLRWIMGFNLMLLGAVLLAAFSFIARDARRGQEANHRHLEEFRQTAGHIDALAKQVDSLVAEQLPLSPLLTHQLVAIQKAKIEINRIAADGDLGNEKLSSTIEAMQERQQQISEGWPAGLARDSLQEVEGNVLILADITEELSQNRSPVQRAEMAADAEQAAADVEQAMDHMNEILMAEAARLNDSVLQVNREGLQAVRRSLTSSEAVDRLLARIQAKTFWGLCLFFVLILFLQLGFFLVLRRRLATIVDLLRRIAQQEGDLTQRLDIETRDELGELARWFNLFVERLGTTIGRVKGKVEELFDASESLAASATQMSANSSEIRMQAHLVASSSSQMTMAIGAIASSNEESSAGMAGLHRNLEVIAGEINLFARLVDRQSADLGEVAAATRNAMDLSTEAEEKTRSTLSLMGELSDTASSIGKVLEVIDTISRQTKMLSFNATIEASKAGEAGKGFAVVAGEVKGLATQTALASQEIAAMIETIQRLVSESFSGTEELTGIIGRLAAINRAIMESSDSQSQRAGDLANTIERVAASCDESAANAEETRKGLAEIAHRSTESATGVREVDTSMHTVMDALGELNTGIGLGRDNARQLNDIAQELQQAVRFFTVDGDRQKTKKA